MGTAAPGPGEPQTSKGQSQRIAAPLPGGDGQQGAHSAQTVTANLGSALSQPVTLGSVLPLSVPPVSGAPVSLPRASRPAWPCLDTAADGSDGRGFGAWVEEGVPGGVATGPSWGAVDPLEGLELLLDLDNLGPSRSVGADAAGPSGAASGDAGPAFRRRGPRWDASIGPAARRAELGDLTTEYLGMARTRGFVTLHDLARAAAWLGHDAALLDELCARLDAEGVSATEAVAHTSLRGASLEGIAARFSPLLARTPDERAILRRLGYGPKLIAELSAECRAFAVRAFALHQLTRAQEEELVRVEIDARAETRSGRDGAAVERAKLALFHDNLWDRGAPRASLPRSRRAARRPDPGGLPWHPEGDRPLRVWRASPLHGLRGALDRATDAAGDRRHRARQSGCLSTCRSNSTGWTWPSGRCWWPSAGHRRCTSWPRGWR